MGRNNAMRRSGGPHGRSGAKPLVARDAARPKVRGQAYAKVARQVRVGVQQGEHVAQEQAIRVVAEQRIVALARTSGGQEERRRVALAAPHEPSAPEGCPDGALPGAEPYGGA